MDVVDSINKAIDGINNLTNKGVPLKLEHEIDKDSLSYMAVSLFVAGLILILISGFKDYVVGQALQK